MGRRNRRSENAEFELYSAPAVLGVRFLRNISAKAGDEMCAKGSAKLIFIESVGRYCFQLVDEPESPKRSELDDARESCTVLSKAETEAVVGFFGESKTAGLSKQTRSILEDLKRETHDFVERSQVKLSAFDPRNGRTVISA